MHPKFLKFFALVILILGSFFFGKHLIINAQTGSNSVKVNCSPSSLCGGAIARVFVPQGGCPSGDEECGKNNYQQDKPIPSGSTTVTLPGIPDGVYTIILIKDGYVTNPPKVADVSLSGGITTEIPTFTLNLDTSQIKSFTATPKGIESGGSSTLAWQTEGLTNCSINNGVGSVPSNGQNKTVKPTITTTYTLSCYNSVGIKKTKTVTVTVNGTGGGGTDPALTLSSNTVKKGESIKVTWSNIPDPTKYDVVGFFNDPDAWADWSKVNGSGYTGTCTKNVTDSSANGSCSFLIPASTEAGTYKFRYRHCAVSNDNCDFSTVVTSNSFTVTSSSGGGGGTGTGGGGGGTGGTGGGASCNATDVVPLLIETPPDNIYNGGNNMIGIGGSGANRVYVVSKSYGYTTYNLSDLNNPFWQFRTNALLEKGGGPFHATPGSAHSGNVFSGTAISKDGTRLISQGDEPYYSFVYKNLGDQWSPRLVGGGRIGGTAQIVKRSDGKYLAFTPIAGLDVIDISDDKIARTINNAEDIPISNINVIHTMAGTEDASYPLSTSGNYVLYVTSDLKRIRVIDVSKTLGSPDITSNMTSQYLNISDFRLDASKYAGIVSINAAGSKDGNPAHIYVFARFFGNTPGVISTEGAALELLDGVVKNTWNLSFPAEYSGVNISSTLTDQNRAYVSAIGPRVFFMVRAGSQNIFMNFTINEDTEVLTSGVITIKDKFLVTGSDGKKYSWGGVGQYDLVEENNTVYIYMANSGNYWIKAPCTTVADTSPSVRIESFTVTPPFIKLGEVSKLVWKTISTFPANTGKNYVTLNGETVAEEGSIEVTLSRTTNYTLKISRDGGPGARSGGSSCSETNLVPTRVDIYKNKPAIFANGYSGGLTLSGTGSNRKLTINQDFGFTAFSLVDPNYPTIIQHKNMTTNGNPPGGPFSKTGDGQSVVQGLSASTDGSRMLVGWSDVPDDFIVLKDFNGSWEVQAEGNGDTTRPRGLGIVKRPDGKYIGFELLGTGLYAADISDPLPTAYYDYPDGGGRSTAPVFKPYIVPNTSFDPNTPGSQVSGLQQAGNYVAYSGDVDRTNMASMRNGNAIVLVDASKSLGNPNIASNFAVKRLSMNDLGIPTSINNGMLSSVINGFTITASQSDPDIIYLFVDVVKDYVPDAIYAYKISSSGSVVTPLTGSPANPPAPFIGTGVQSGGRPFAYTTANNSRAFFFRKTSSLMGFINATVTGSTVSVNVATTPYSSSVLGLGLSNMQGFEENNIAYIYTAHGSFMNAWKINCNNSVSSIPSSACTQPTCDSATRVVTVDNGGGGGTGVGGADDGTGRRSWYWWLKYYLNL